MSHLGVPGIYRRLASAIYDSLLLLAVTVLLVVLPHMLLGLVFNFAAPRYVLLAHLIIVVAVYFLWYWHHGGQTLAMQTWKIRLVSASGTPAPWPRLLLRFALAWPSIGFYGAGLLWALFDRDRQFLHDRLAGTRIIFK